MKKTYKTKTNHGYFSLSGTHCQDLDPEIKHTHKFSNQMDTRKILHHFNLQFQAKYSGHLC